MLRQDLLDRKEALETTLLDEILTMDTDRFNAIIKDIDDVNNQLESVELEIPLPWEI